MRKTLKTIELLLVGLTVVVTGLFGVVKDDIQSDITPPDTNTSVIAVKEEELEKFQIKPEQNLSAYDKELEEMTQAQYNMMLSILHHGEQYELGITLAAIAWKESGMGKFNMKLADGKHGSFGPFHILLDYSAVRHNRMNDWGRSRLAERLIEDIEFSIKEAVDVLRAFKTKNCDQTCAIARYNGGYNGKKNNRAKAYAKDVEKRKVAIIKYMERHYTKMAIDSIAMFGSEKAKLALNESWSIPDFISLYEAE